MRRDAGDVLGACGGSVAEGGRERPRGARRAHVRQQQRRLLSQIEGYIERSSGSPGTCGSTTSRLAPGRTGTGERLIEDVQGGQGRHGLGRGTGVRRGRGEELPGMVAPLLVDSYELQDKVFAAGIPAGMLGGRTSG